LLITNLIILNVQLICAESEAEKVLLSEALTKKWVKAQLTGINDAPQVGRLAGESIMLRAQNVSRKPLELIISQGTVLRTDVQGVSDMVVNRVVGIPKGPKEISPASEIILEDSEPKEYVLEAYSLDFEQDPPTFSDSFTVNGKVHSKIRKLLEILSEIPVENRSKEAVQIAIWKLTNSESEENFQTKTDFPIEQKDLADAQIILTKAELEKVRITNYRKSVAVEGAIYCLLPVADNELRMEAGSCPGGSHLHMLKTGDGRVITLRTSQEMTEEIAKLSAEEKAHSSVTGKSAGRLVIDPELIEGVEDH
jgi:hypothetical protein